ncbi:diol dehydratase reactivase ATPase-like domain-containing protein, partial [Streptococcus suis]
PGVATARSIALATLTSATEVDVAAQVTAIAAAGRPVLTVAHESDAARAGALSTPGAAPDAVVVDIGGGTADVVLRQGEARVLAGAGDLVTRAT